MSLPTLSTNCLYLLGDGSIINFWTDYWLPNLQGSITDYLNITQQRRAELHCNVADYIHNYCWRIPPSLENATPQLVEEIKNYPIPKGGNKDQLIWSHFTDGRLSVKEDYDFIRTPNNTISGTNRFDLSSFLLEV
ncbi:hypothetical protein BVC80_8241g3 [Macleaya cordata]|uniref:Uncharacterized protein n=1 Tax=Macleaya cordata TaxID=56857 RepID=A0A200Q7F0_MACCD|nr:hypothetical protein BVC80_8241g3 [Macleaya cordata]